jgi:hypothetical protein
MASNKEAKTPNLQEPASDGMDVAPTEQRIHVHLRKIPLLADLSDEELVRVKSA